MALSKAGFVIVGGCALTALLIHRPCMCVVCYVVTFEGMALSKAGFMIVGDSVRVGQRVRFMVSIITGPY